MPEHWSCAGRWGETPHFFQMVWGLRSFHVMRLEFQRARELAEQLLTLAQHRQESALLLEAHHALENTLFWLGELGLTLEHEEQGMALYDPQQHRSLAFIYGTSDPGVRCISFTAWALGLLGYPDQALQRSHRALRIARELAHPFSLAYALNVAAWLHQFRRGASLTRERAETMLALSREHGFALFATGGTVLQGWALAEQGQGEVWLAQMRRGLAALRITGVGVTETYFLALLAEAYGKRGRAGEGFAVPAEALAAVGQRGVRFYEAELHRIKGELLLTQVAGGASSPSVSAGPSRGAEAEHPGLGEAGNLFSSGDRCRSPPASQMVGVVGDGELKSAVAAAGQASGGS